MVTFNTEIARNYDDLEFKYLLEIPKSDCIFCSTRERSTGRTYLYLVFNAEEKVYFRNGLKGIWVELKNRIEQHQFREILWEAIRTKSIPCYSNVNALSIFS